MITVIFRLYYKYWFDNDFAMKSKHYRYYVSSLFLKLSVGNGFWCIVLFCYYQAYFQPI